MKLRKLLAVLLCLCMTALCASVMAGAVPISKEVTESTWGEAELKAFIVQQGEYLWSDMNDKYEGDWWYEERPELDDQEETLCPINCRGFIITPDRHFAVMGHLLGTAYRGAALLDLRTGEITDCYAHYEEEYEAGGFERYSFAKGLAADDRGYVYVGFALSSNYNLVNLGIAQINEESRTLNEVYLGAVYEWGTPGDVGGIHVGVNGVDVAKIGDRYYCYVMVNYDYDALYCYDVTDPAHPALNESFGSNGMIVFSEDDCAVKTDDCVLDEGYYMDIDDNGVIWLCASFKSGSKGIMEITPDGSSCVTAFNCHNAYSICHCAPYFVVGDKSGEGVFVLDDTSFEEIASVKFDDDTYGTWFSMVQVIDDILFVCDCDGDDSGLLNAIMVAPLTGEAEGIVEDMVRSLSGETGDVETDAADETAADTDAPTADTEPAADETAADTAADTAAPGNETAADTAADAADTDAPAAEGGCASVMGVCAVLAVILAAGGVMVSKKK